MPVPAALTRAVAGLVAAAAIAAVARRAHSLSTSGAVAATVVGAACVAAGWDWGALLMVFFVTSTLLSRVGRSAKEERTRAIVEKGGERDVVQVLANGGVFGLSAALFAVRPSPLWQALGVGALAAATADTWATEIGTLAGGHPRSIISLQTVPRGTSGGITLAGTLASIAGSFIIAAAAALCHWPPTIAWWAVVGGIVGSLADSLLGARWQSRRWCATCNIQTERRVHPCGTTTVPAGGVLWLDNDAVNALSTVLGAVATCIGVRASGGL
jgi:uncharacterized protein (TIGR00297 family)